MRYSRVVLSQKKTVEEIKVDENGEFIRDPQKDLVKVAVVERHRELETSHVDS